jgi:hypothetical protein
MTPFTGARRAPDMMGRRDDPDDPIAAPLRALFDDAGREPLPERFVALLDRLARGEGRQ